MFPDFMQGDGTMEAPSTTVSERSGNSAVFPFDRVKGKTALYTVQRSPPGGDGRQALFALADFKCLARVLDLRELVDHLDSQPAILLDNPVHI